MEIEIAHELYDPNHHNASLICMITGHSLEEVLEAAGESKNSKGWRCMDFKNTIRNLGFKTGDKFSYKANFGIAKCVAPYNSGKWYSCVFANNMLHCNGESFSPEELQDNTGIYFKSVLQVYI